MSVVLLAAIPNSWVIEKEPYDIVAKICPLIKFDQNRATRLCTDDRCQHSNNSVDIKWTIINFLTYQVILLTYMSERNKNNILKCTNQFSFSGQIYPSICNCSDVYWDKFNIRQILWPIKQHKYLFISLTQNVLSESYHQCSVDGLIFALNVFRNKMFCTNF